MLLQHFRRALELVPRIAAHACIRVKPLRLFAIRALKICGKIYHVRWNASVAHFFRRNLGLRSGISDFGTCTSLRASASNSLKPVGFFGFFASMLVLLLQPHESAAVNLAQLPPGHPPPAARRSSA